jgi:hypothetical protein
MCLLVEMLALSCEGCMEAVTRESIQQRRTHFFRYNHFCRASPAGALSYNGQLKSKGSFAFQRRGYFGSSWTDTVPIGKAYKYSENGSLIEESNFDGEGNLDGVRILIDEKGKRTEALYRKGTLVAKKIFSSDGKLELNEEYYEDGSRK